MMYQKLRVESDRSCGKPFLLNEHDVMKKIKEKDGSYTAASLHTSDRRVSCLACW